MIVQVVFVALCLCFVVGNQACQEIKSCRECVRDISCKWCSADDFKDLRCMAVTKETNCTQIKNPEGTIAYDDYSGTLIKPQLVKAILQPTVPKTFNFTFKTPENHPVDMYFLFDISYGMQEALKTIAEASEKIYNEMKNQTNDVLIGMGTFVDKNTAPFRTEREITSFKHVLDMTAIIKDFREEVNKVANDTMKNGDVPEGGFDALAQVITCKEQFGWRTKSRKFIFFFTDASCHTTGDGKFAGIVYPYDGQCYTKNGRYTKELEMDYPSIGMINELAVKEGVTIIFLVYEDQAAYYKGMAKNIYGSTTLIYEKKNNAINFKSTVDTSLEKVIRQKYEEITHNMVLEVIMDTEKDKNNVKVTFAPNCIKQKNPSEECNVKIGVSKEIVGTIKVLRNYEVDSINIAVRIAGVKESLKLNVKLVDCDCEQEFNSTYCSAGGTKICGVCECNNDRTGNNCECKLDDLSRKDHQCVPSNAVDVLPCSGFGHCVCGVCKCPDSYGGDFCECSKNSCGVNTCNGRGECYCGECKSCEKPWIGTSCECHNVTCVMINNKECNDQGSCVCGKCKCKGPAEWDARHSRNSNTCEMKPCHDCHFDQCQKLLECATCRQSEDENTCLPYCRGIRVKIVNAIPNETADNVWICENMQAKSTGCYIRYQYQYDDESNTINLLVPGHADCNENYYKLGGGILVALLLIGLLTIVGWKLLTDARDRREYERFLKMHDSDGQTCLNPIYESAVTTIPNPAFRRPSVDYTLN